MTTITREQLRERAREKVKSLEFAVTQTAFSENRAELEEELELARIALASLEAEPVGTFRKGPCGYSPSFHEDAMPLYAAPPAQLVPEEVSWEDVPEEITEDNMEVALAWAHGFNHCRAAMLQGSQPVSKREQVRREHAEWSDKTFGDVGPVGPLKHLSKEALEAAAEPDDLSEWADMQFLLWDAQRRAGISDGEITAAMEEKLKVNMARQWPEPKDGEPRQHLKPAPQTVPDSVISAAVNGIMATYADNAEDCREMVRTHVEQACRAAIQESGHG